MATRGGNEKWQALSDTTNKKGAPVIQTPPLRDKQCDTCVCRVCWTLSGYNPRRCAVCPESGCRVGRDRAETCAAWLDDALRAGRVHRAANTTAPPNIEALQNIVVTLSPEGDAAAPEAIPQRLHAWASTFADDLAVGRVQLLEVFDLALEDALDDGLPPCPVCNLSVRGVHGAARLGICRRCNLERLKLATDEKVREVAALRDYEASKQQLRRERDLAGVLPDRLVKKRDYSGRVRLRAGSDGGDTISSTGEAGADPAQQAARTASRANTNGQGPGVAGQEPGARRERARAGTDPA